MASYINNEFPLERLSKQLNSDNKRVVALYGLEEEQAPDYLNQIKELNQENINIAAWTMPAPASKEELSEDIKATLLVNTTTSNLKNIKSKNFINAIFKKIHTNRIRRKINEYQPYKQENSKTKTLLWPVISTVSSLGLALGVPLLSVILFRQDAIIYGTENAEGVNSGALGETFYIGMITLAVSLIVLGAFSSILGLIVTIIQNKKAYNWTNVSENLQKIINKYFVLQTSVDYYKNLTWRHKISYKFKFVIDKDYTFFYTNVDPNGDDYSEILELMKILNSLNNNIIYCLQNVNYIDDIRIFKNIFPTGKTRIIRMNTYKNGSNIRIMTNFMISQIKQITGLDIQTLSRKYPYFINALYKFIDKSTSNDQFLGALLMLKKFVGKISNSSGLNDNVEKYFIDLFCLSIFNGLDNAGFQMLYRDLSLYGDISDQLRQNDNFVSLKIYEIINRNLIEYETNSIFFKLKDFMIGVATLKNISKAVSVNTKTEINIPVDKQYITSILENRGYKNIENDKPLNYSMKFISNFNDSLYVKFGEISDNNSSGLVYLESILKRAKEDQISAIIIDIYGMKMYYQKIEDHFELISNL